MGFVFDLLKYAHISIVIDKYQQLTRPLLFSTAAQAKTATCCIRSIYGHILTCKIHRVYLQRFITHRK